MDMKSQNNMRHYFIASEHDEKDFFQFNHEQQGEHFSFTSCDDVFSKNQIDFGSQVLIDTIIKYSSDYSGKILDICCGYGTIGIILSRCLDVKFDMCDINSLAVKLASINVKNNHVNVDKVFESNMWENVDDTYSHIVSNPPIKVGKKVLLDFLGGIKNHLEKDGSVTIVIKKNLGADSTKKYLTDIFGNCEVLARIKGYYILRSKNT